MLVLSRRIGETLIISDNIKVTVLGITGTQVRIGIEAPQEISVHRQEVHERISGERPDPPPPPPERNFRDRPIQGTIPLRRRRAY